MRLPPGVFETRSHRDDGGLGAARRAWSVRVAADLPGSFVGVADQLVRAGRYTADAWLEQRVGDPTVAGADRPGVRAIRHTTRVAAGGRVGAFRLPTTIRGDQGHYVGG